MLFFQLLLFSCWNFPAAALLVTSSSLGTFWQRTPRRPAELVFWRSMAWSVSVGSLLLNLIFLTSSSTLLLSTSGKKKFSLHLQKLGKKKKSWKIWKGNLNCWSSLAPLTEAARLWLGDKTGPFWPAAWGGIFGCIGKYWEYWGHIGKYRGNIGKILVNIGKIFGNIGEVLGNMGLKMFFFFCLLELDILLAKSAFLRSLGFPQNLGTYNSADSSFENSSWWRRLYSTTKMKHILLWLFSPNKDLHLIN